MSEIRSFVSLREVQRAGAAVRAAVKRGELVRPATCAWCGTDQLPIQAHHPDYARPLMVVWICRKCHSSHHAKYAMERHLFDPENFFVSS